MQQHSVPPAAICQAHKGAFAAARQVRSPAARAVADALAPFAAAGEDAQAGAYPPSPALAAPLAPAPEELACAPGSCGPSGARPCAGTPGDFQAGLLALRREFDGVMQNIERRVDTRLLELRRRLQEMGHD
eukprot:TRINITY_DN31390_c0_g1_i1.p3 TRINITY_DN31390_c0_g1~~TRINITY_DN31390_c0_g1_i1.p3  ORF type:complete len:131 (+),score=30.92 TRINITY_DN31390_c0_g1_i1:139-531(+)